MRDRFARLQQVNGPSWVDCGLRGPTSPRALTSGLPVGGILS
jgi:hypothetical protein